MLHAMRSNSMNARREACVEAAYNSLDKSKNQTVTIADLEDNYDCTVNPEYVRGIKTAEHLKEEFRACWDTVARDYVVPLGEFLDFYKDVSPSIISDEVFENMVKNTWHL